MAVTRQSSHLFCGNGHMRCDYDKHSLTVAIAEFEDHNLDFVVVLVCSDF